MQNYFFKVKSHYNIIFFSLNTNVMNKVQDTDFTGNFVKEGYFCLFLF